MKSHTFHLLTCVVVILLCSIYTPVFADEAATSTISIHLNIESATSTLFAGDIEVVPCAASASSSPIASGYCAIRQSGLENSWTSYGDAQFLSSLGGSANDYSTNTYWNWFADLSYGQVSLDQHILTPHETLLVSIGRMPLKLTLSTTTPAVGATTTISVLQFGFDDSWNGVWTPAASSTATIIVSSVNTSYPVGSDGTYGLLISTSTPFIVSASQEGFLTTNRYAITPVVYDAPVAYPTFVGGGSTSGTSVGGSNDTTSTCTFDTAAATQFLTTQQRSDGSFGSSLYTDWAAVAYASAPASSGRSRLISYLTTSHPSMSSATDYERHAMALMALGINPYTGTSVNYIQKITTAFDGTQVGDTSLVNDDIFAIFPLVRAGYQTDDPMIRKIVAFIISLQQSDGSWSGSIDMTAAAIQALRLTAPSEASDSIARAKRYLTAHQESDGGFGSSFGTGWVLQAIAALGESPSSWIHRGTNPQTALCRLQQTDGGLESPITAVTTRTWATSYAIPAMQGDTWAATLSYFPRYTAPVVATNLTPTNVTSTQATTSSPVMVASSTIPAPQIDTNIHIPEHVERTVVTEVKPAIRTTQDTTHTLPSEATTSTQSQLSAAVLTALENTGFPNAGAIAVGSIVGLSVGSYVLFMLKKPL